jgi:hypothetical protein
MTKFSVYILATHWTITLENCLASLRKHNFPYTLLAQGKKWQGWKWRTEQYLRQSMLAKDDELMVFLDGFDTLCAKSSVDFVMNFDAFRSNIVIGCEWYCGNSKNCGNVDSYWTHNDFNGMPMRKYINAGCVIGKAFALRKMYAWIVQQPIDDDQLALAAWVNNHPFECNLDYGSSLVYNAHILDLHKTPSAYFLHYPGPFIKHYLYPRYNKDVHAILGKNARILYCNESMAIFLYIVLICISLFLLYKFV